MTSKSSIIKQLKRTNASIMLRPFVLLFIYVVYFSILFIAGVKLMALDLTFYISPLFVLVNLVDSCISNMCNWHKVACALPLLPFSVHITHCYLFDINLPISIATHILLFLLFIYSAYKVFFSNGRRQRNDKST